MGSYRRLQPSRKHSPTPLHRSPSPRGQGYLHKSNPARWVFSPGKPEDSDCNHDQCTIAERGNAHPLRGGPQFATTFRKANSLARETDWWRRWERNRTSFLGKLTRGGLGKPLGRGEGEQ